jgi:ElaB/YqjD/DUF883 family membrane-anchored ribosome-binding protein
METNFEKLEKAHRLIAQDRVLNDLKTLARDAEDLMKATAGELGEKAREARARLAHALEAAKATCADLQAQMVVAAKGAAQQADTAIRDNPYQSIGIAFGLGVLIGVLVARR